MVLVSLSLLAVICGVSLVSLVVISTSSYYVVHSWFKDQYTIQPIRQRRRDRRKAAKAQDTIEEIVVINTLDDLVDAQATVNTAAAENVVSSKLSEAEQIPAVDASYDATQTEEAVQVAGEVACDDVTEEVSADKIDIDKENTDVAEEVTEKDTVVSYHK